MTDSQIVEALKDRMESALRVAKSDVDSKTASWSYDVYESCKHSLKKFEALSKKYQSTKEMALRCAQL